ncbi:MAG: helix-turn-helix transcriptional regulator [Alphaproteobacteria bacterium GM202ARS2]|nr:helix-turn-helix transcriptional regulator [Alphaproteobacteria bacterium GM202ARS2]
MSEWHNQLLSLIKDRGLTAVGLSEKVGLNRGYVSDLVNRQAYPTLINSYRIAAALGVSLDEFYHGTGYFAPRNLTIMGTLTHGGQVIPVPDNEQRTAATPAFGPDVTTLLVDVATLRHDVGDMLIGTKTDGANIGNLISRECIIQLLTGACVVGILTRGTEPNRFSVRFFDPTQPPIENVAVDWAARIECVVKAS